MDDQSTTTSLRVRYHETDQMGFVYHSHYIVWFDVGRTEWIRSALGMSYKSIEEQGLILPVTKVECRYIKSARYDDECVIRTTLAGFSGVTLRFHYVVLRQATHEVLAEGWTENSFVGPDGRPIRLRRHHPELASLLVSRVVSAEGSEA